jgi:hypothetical protein
MCAECAADTTPLGTTQDGIEGRVPGQVLCREEAVTCLNVLPRGNASEVYTQQHLYTIYVHTKPEFPGYPEGSLFHQRVVPSPIQTAWGDHSIATALRLLLAEALRDPFNQRFQLLCPATVPIRPALFTYTQLIAEERSRIGWYGPVRSTFSHSACICMHAGFAFDMLPFACMLGPPLRHASICMHAGSPG